MPMYQFTLIDQGCVLGSQDVECTDDAMAEHETYDGLDPLAQAREGKTVKWVECRKLTHDA